MRWALSYFEGVTAPNGLLPYDERYWVFLDWADIFKEGYATVYNLFYFMTLERPRGSSPSWAIRRTPPSASAAPSRFAPPS